MRRIRVSAPRFCWFSVPVLLLFLFSMGCEEREPWIEQPFRYLKTEELPGYIQRIPLFGVNGHSGLGQIDAGTTCFHSGVYVGGKTGGFIRTFNDSVLFHIPFQEHLPCSSEVTLVAVEGTVVQKGEFSLSDVRMLSAEEIEMLYQRVVASYPLLMEYIADAVEDPKSKLDLNSIKQFHCAARGGELLIFGRTYDLMYEFDLAFLFCRAQEHEQEQEYGQEQKNGRNSFHLKHIYASHLFKGE